MATGSGTGTPVAASATAPTNAQIVAAIDLAIYNNMVAGGPLSFNFGGQRTEFRSIAEMKAARMYFQDLVDAATRGGSVCLGGLSNNI